MATCHRIPVLFAKAALLAAVLTTLGAATLRAEEKLIAPVYQGAVRLSPVQLKNMAPVEFAAKDAHDKVAEFYIPKYGHLALEGEAERSASNMTTAIIMTENQILKYILSVKGNYTESRPAVVEIEWKARPTASDNAVNRVLRELKSQARRFKTHEAELAEIEAKYAFLKSSYLFEDRAKEILLRYGREAGIAMQFVSDPKVTKDYANEVKKLAQEGRNSELAGLQQKYFSELPDAEKRRKADNFGLWTKALGDLVAVSYLTKLTIDKHPSQWDLSWEKKH